MKELNSTLLQIIGTQSYAQASGEIKGVGRRRGGEGIGLVKNSHGSKKRWVGDEWRWLEGLYGL